MTAITAGRARAGRGRAASAAQVATRRHRLLLATLLAATAVLYLVGLSRNGWGNDFYAAAVQAGTKSWKAFFFGSFDAASFITVDKTPASLWVMELPARVFGLNSWSMLVPQALEGVASVALLYSAVRRWYGPAAGLVAGTALALTPVATLMFRYNNPDALLVLLMTAAAYAMVRAVESGRTRWLVLAGSLLGFGFLTKMLQAFLVLPAFGVLYLVAGPRRLRLRLAQLLAGLVAVIVSAGWWVAIVMLTPAADRPYVGGSTNDSILQLALGYNGFGRLDGDETGSVGFTGASHGTGPAFSGPAGLGRLFAAEMGGQISWLLPAALLAIAALLVISWLPRWFTQPGQSARPGRSGNTLDGRAGRLDLDRATVLLWGGWLMVTGVTFSFMQGIIHPYYTIALAPPIAALVGVGAVRLWQHAESWAARGFLAAGVALSAIWSYVLLDRTPDWLPALRYGVLFAGLAAAAALLAVAPTGTRHSWRQFRSAAIVAPALVAMLAGPLAYSLDTVAATHTGALPTAGPATDALGGPGGPAGGSGFGAPGSPGRARGAPGGTRRGAGAGSAGADRQGFPGGGLPGGGLPGGGFGSVPGSTGRHGSAGSTRPGQAGAGSGATGLPGAAGGAGLGGSTTVSKAVIRLLEHDSGSYTWAAATVGSESAAPLQLATDLPIMSIGGFNGTDPVPTLAQFKQLVAERKIHYFAGTNADSFGGGSGDAQAITAWVTSHFRGADVGGLEVYNLSS